MATLRDLGEDGWEQLGEIELGGTMAAGDPVSLVSPIGSRTWFAAAVRPGRWQVLGRPWAADKDYLEEITLVHREALRSFYDLYDEAQLVGSYELPRRRLAVLDAALRADEEVLRSLATVEELPWVLERGLVTEGIGEHPVQVVVPRTPQVELVSFGLGAAPSSQAASDPFSYEAPGDED